MCIRDRIYASGVICDTQIGVQTLRMFEPAFVTFKNNRGSHFEDPLRDKSAQCLDVPLSVAIIKHFLPIV
jgi:hypothetical protein